jgi:hypothetical protein
MEQKMIDVLVLDNAEIYFEKDQITIKFEGGGNPLADYCGKFQLTNPTLMGGGRPPHIFDSLSGEVCSLREDVFEIVLDARSRGHLVHFLIGHHDSEEDRLFPGWTARQT